MATDGPLKNCANCNRTAFHTGSALKRCLKCKQVGYCNRDCQTQHYQKHKKECGKPRSASTTASSSSTSATTPEPSSFLEKPHTHPFQALAKRQWLSDRTQHDVYKLLVDSFRLRLEDYFTMNDEIEVGSIYHNGNEHSAKAFEDFLLMAWQSEVFPEWINEKKLGDCIVFGMRSSMVNSEWGGLRAKTRPEDIAAWYGDESMPLQMRIFAEQVYGDDPSGQAKDMKLRAHFMAGSRRNS